MSSPQLFFYDHELILFIKFYLHILFFSSSGLTPIATCSPENRDMLLALGAVETFDYHNASCGMEIRNYTQNTLAHVIDCVTQAESMKLSYEAIGPQGGRYIALDPFPTRIQYTRRFVNVTLTGGKRKVCEISALQPKDFES